MEKLFRPAEIAELLGLTEKEVHKLVRQGRLSCIEISSKKRRFSRANVDEFLSNATKTGHQPKKVDSKSRTLLPSVPHKSKGGDKPTEGFSAKALREEMRQWH